MRIGRKKTLDSKLNYGISFGENPQMLRGAIDLNIWLFKLSQKFVDNYAYGAMQQKDDKHGFMFTLTIYYPVIEKPYRWLPKIDLW